MIKFSNGHALDFACGSGALGFSGIGWFWEQPLRWLGLLTPQDITVVSKTITADRRKGNLRWTHPWSSVKSKHGNYVNAVGLTNPGIKTWIAKHYQKARNKDYNIAVSIQPVNWVEATYMDHVLSDLKLAYVEVNLSCPNQEISTFMPSSRMFASHPMVAKISYAQATDNDFLERIEKAGFEAIHAINSIPWQDIYGQLPSPLKKSMGAVSGPIIKNYALEAIEKIKSVCNLPIIGGGGIYTLDDVLDFESAGADAFSIGTLFLRKPWRPRKIVRDYRYKQYLKSWKNLSPY